jgi:dTMP kinase
MALLFAADRTDPLERELEPALGRGAHVVSDRYLMSSLAYQSVHVDREWVAALNARARPPDVTVVLDLPVELALERRLGRGGSDELYDANSIQRQVRANYLAEAEHARRGGAHVTVIDASSDVERVFAAVWQAVEPWLAP